LVNFSQINCNSISACINGTWQLDYGSDFNTLNLSKQ